MNNSYITIIKEKRTALSRKRVPLNQNECTDDFRIGVPFEQNLHTPVLFITFFQNFKQNHYFFTIVIPVLLFLKRFFVKFIPSLPEVLVELLQIVYILRHRFCRKHFHVLTCCVLRHIFFCLS